MKNLIVVLILLIISNYGIAQEKNPFSLKINFGYQNNYGHNLKPIENTDMFTRAIIPEITYYSNIGMKTEAALSWEVSKRIHLNFGIGLYQSGFKKTYIIYQSGCFISPPARGLNNYKFKYASTTVGGQYDFLKWKKMNLFIETSLMVDVLLRNWIYSNEAALGFPLKKKSFSSIFKLGVSYQHSKRISSMVSFHYQTALRAYSKVVNNKTNHYYPYSFGINLGLKFKL